MRGSGLEAVTDVPCQGEPMTTDARVDQRDIKKRTRKEKTQSRSLQVLASPRRFPMLGQGAVRA